MAKGFKEGSFLSPHGEDPVWARGLKRGAYSSSTDKAVYGRGVYRGELSVAYTERTCMGESFHLNFRFPQGF